MYKLTSKVRDVVATALGLLLAVAVPATAVQFYGPGSGYFTSTATFNKTSGSGDFENVAKFRVSDDNAGSIDIVNTYSSNSTFVGGVAGTSGAANEALVVRGIITTDSGSAPAILLQSQRTGNNGISTRPLVSVKNLSTEVVQITAAGGLKVQGGTAPSLTVGASGTAITQMRVYSQALTPASVAANTSAEQTFTVTGLTTADKVFVNGPALTAGTAIVGVRVSAADTLAITFGNLTAGALTPASGTYNVVAVRN